MQKCISSPFFYHSSLVLIIARKKYYNTSLYMTEEKAMVVSDYLSKKLTEQIIQYNFIPEEQKASYEYCFDFVFDLFFYNSSLFLIGLAFDKAFLSILYIITLSPLKMLAGGYHATSRLRCSFLSYSIFMMVLFLSDKILSFISTPFLLVGYIIMNTLVIAFSPVAPPQHHFNNVEKKKLRTLCLFYSILLLFLYIILLLKTQTIYYTCMTLCIMIILISQVIGHIQYTKKGVENYDSQNRPL